MVIKMRTLPLALVALVATTVYAQASDGSNRTSSPTSSVSAPPAGEDNPDILTYDQSGHLMAVPVTVGDQGPYAFLVDSGAERTIISKELADKLALQRGRDVRVHSMTDTRTAQTSFIPHLRFSKRRVRDIHAPALPAEFIGAAGVLGVDSLARQRVVFDFANRTMTITTSSPEREKWSPDTIVITGRSLYGRLVLTDARIDGEKIVAIIDTGSELTIGNEALRKRLLAKKRLGRTVPFQLRSLTGQVFNVDYAPVGRVTLGGVAIDDMAIGFADAHPFKHLRLTNTPAIMLGMDALRLFSRVSVDFARKEVRLMLPGSATLDGQTLLALSRVELGNGSN